MDETRAMPSPPRRQEGTARSARNDHGNYGGHEMGAEVEEGPVEIGNDRGRETITEVEEDPAERCVDSVRPTVARN